VGDLLPAVEERLEDQELMLPLLIAADLMIADFNSGVKPNNLGGDFGAWIKDPADPMQGAVESFDTKNRFGGKGYALRLIYSVALKQPAFGGLWFKLPGVDASKYDALALRVRGEAGLGYTQVFKVELKDAVDQSSNAYVRSVGDQWQDIVIPLGHFSGMANAKKLNELVIVIEDTTATVKQGVLYFDDVRFVSKRP
jgi:hypothetical protein